jgi:hypothetical protein
VDTLNRYTVADIVNSKDQRKLASVFAAFAGWNGSEKGQTIRKPPGLV